MAIEYFLCYHSYRRTCEKLTDQELGRLFRALLKYSETGEKRELAGRESIAFDFIADDIDRAKLAYEEKCQTNKANGSKGGRPKAKKPNGFSENPKNPNKEKEEEKEERKEYEESKAKKNNPPLPPLQAGEELQAAFSSWLRYKQERREGYKPVGLQALVSEVRNNADTYGEAAVAALIRECMANGWKGIIFDRLKKAEPGARSAQSDGTTNPFLQFTGGGSA